MRVRRWRRVDDLEIVVSSDWHLDAVTAGAPRMDDVLANLEIVKSRSLRAKAHLFLGDLADPDSASAHRCVEHAARFARVHAEAGVETHWLRGNHDGVEDGESSSTLSPIVGAFAAKVFVHERPSVRELAPGVVAVFLPFPMRSDAYDPEAFIRDAAKQVDAPRVFVFGHLAVAGAALGSETHDMPRGRDVLFPTRAIREAWGERAVMLNGHYHAGQRTESGVFIPGAPERFTFGEIGNAPSFLVLHPFAANPIERVLLKARPMVRVGVGDRAWSGGDAALEELREVTADPRTLVRVDPPANVDPVVFERVKRSAGRAPVVMPPSRASLDASESVLSEVGAAACRAAALSEATRIGGERLRSYVAEIVR